MEEEGARRHFWQESPGIIVALVSAMLLLVVLWKISLLSKEAGLDRSALQRERVAVAETHRILWMLDGIDAYRYALVLSAPDLARRRTEAELRVHAVGADFRSGPASTLGLYDRWKHFDAAWHEVLRVPPGAAAYGRTASFMPRIPGLLAAIEDASNLSYDPSVTAQNLGDAYTDAAPYTVFSSERLRILMDLAVAQHGMSLKQRLDAAIAMNDVRSAGESTTQDNLPLVATLLTSVLPERAAQWSKLAPMANEMHAAAQAFALLASDQAIEQTAPARSQATFDAAADRLTAAARALGAASAEALDLSLQRRGELTEQRNRYFYLLYVLIAALAVGIMMSIVQLLARRDRLALRRAREEAEALQAQLARKQAEEALRLSEAQFRTVFEGAALGIAIVNQGGTVLQANGTFRSMFGDAFAKAIEGRENELARLFAGEGETFEFEQHTNGPEGQEVWADATISAVAGNHDSALFAICMFRDKTALKQNERRVQHEKTHDPLTGLPNRRYFEDCVKRRFEEAHALLDSFFAVFVVDIENFKDVNESVGHTAGDAVLTQLGGRLRVSIEARDVLARLGNDEFAVLIESLGDILHVESIAGRILNNLSKPVMLGSRPIHVGAHIGIAIGGSNYDRAEHLMRDAEIALQHAKATGSRYAVFDSKMYERTQKRLQLTNDLRLAIERSELRMLYQPIVSLYDDALVGCEALLRWDHPTEGLLAPSEFIPLAERGGLVSLLGHFVLDTAASQLGAWRREYPALGEFGIHVNVSASELLAPDLERRLLVAMQDNGVRPTDVTLEITESVLLDAGTRASTLIERLREHGFAICIDDFGTGYSSMRYLQQFKVDTIKIDRTFVTGADGELASEPIVRTLMTLAEAYDVRVVAEGIETRRQREALRNAGCRLAQGFLFSPALSAAELVEMYPDAFGEATPGEPKRSASA
jgi:diguanylate cyclase (GGDEF)-like protein